MNNPTNIPDGRPYGMPFPTPIESLPPHGVTGDEAAQMLRAAVEHVGPLGDVDRDVLQFHLDSAYLHARGTAVFASLIRRAWQAGVAVGRSERLDEAGVAQAAAAAVARYRGILGRGDGSAASRDFSFSVAVDTAARLHAADAELAAAVRAVLAVDEIEDVAGQVALLDRTFLGQACAAPLPGEATQRDELRPELTNPAEPDRSPAYVLEDPAGDEELVEVEWCRICDEQRAPGSTDGLCTFCREDVAEGRKADPDDQGDGPCEVCGARPARRIPIKAPVDPRRADVLLCAPCLQAVNGRPGGVR